ncbi:MAG: phenylalanine--tRNA ligase subunit beta, partial [Hyphomicrobiaceae bacterium]|nr:phenylalanine--tRNA ligase subunit beta [Hyphomicrobiaceae bacterium]
SENLVAGSPEIEDRVITFPWSEIKRLSGIEIAPREAKAILTRLGFWVVDGGDTAKVAVPSWRADVDGKADLVEEVMRIVGVDKVPLASSLGRDTVVRPVLTPIQRRTRTAKRALAGRGMVEAVTWSFVSQAQAEAFGGGAAALQLANPIAADLSTMRPSLLPGLLAAAQKNADRGFPDVALFEVGQVFADDTPEGQTISATGLRRGTAAMAGAGRHWIGNMPQVSVFNVKGDLFALLSDLGLDPASLQISRDAPAWYHPGRSGTVRRGRDVFGHFGELHPGLLEDLDVDGPIVAFEVTLDALPEAKKKASRARPPLNLSGLMPVRRDFAFLVKETVEAERLVKAARGADKALIADVKLFDRYRGDKIGADEVSLAIEVTLQPKDRTLTDEDLEAVSAKIVAAVEKATGASLRG